MIAPTIGITPEFLQTRPLSYSSLKQFRKSPKHYIQYITKPREQTDAMRQGSLIDCLALEPEKFTERFMIIPKLNLRTNDGKAENERLLKEANEKRLIMITQEDIAKARKSVEALMSTDFSRQLIEGRRDVQINLRWTDKATGLPINGKVDFDSKIGREWFIVDLKSSASADPDDFKRQAYNLDYHIQCGCYTTGYPTHRFTFPPFVFLVVESEEPYNISVNYCDGKYIQEAKEEFTASLNAFKYCMDNNLWHQGYEFRKFGTLPYFTMGFPGYHKPKFRMSDETAE